MGHSHHQFQLIFEQAPLGMIIIGEDGRIMNTNRVFQDIVGYSDQESTGMEFPRIIHPDDLSGLDKLLQKTLNGSDAHPAVHNVRFIHKLGQILCVKTTVSALYPDQGSPVILMVIEDIRQKNIETDFQLLQEAVKQSPVTVVVTDAKGNIQYVNPFFTDVTGYSRDEAIGKNPRILKSGHHPPAFYRQMWSVLSNGKVWRGEVLNKKKNGSLYWEDAVISPIRDDGETSPISLRLKKTSPMKRISKSGWMNWESRMK
jgi:PAS domain S-box-containing protein